MRESGMSTEEKSAWIVGVSLILIYSWYFTTILIEAASAPVDTIDYQDLLVAMVVVFIGVVIAGEIALAVITRDSDRPDERDRKIDRFGEYIGGYVLGAGMLVVLVLAMAEIEYFWIANAALGAMVLAELVTTVTKIVVYRRGFWVGTDDSGYQLG
jgi:hypothetical protein